MLAFLEALSTSDLFNFVIHDTISATPPPGHLGGGLPSSDAAAAGFMLENDSLMKKLQDLSSVSNAGVLEPSFKQHGLRDYRRNLAVQGGRQKKRKRRPRVCKNKEEAETQRMTHIAVERNRRRQMNEHLAELRSLMPDSYVQRGDQASIVGGAIEYVKVLEHMKLSLEGEKLQLPLPQSKAVKLLAQERSSSQLPSKYTCKIKDATADIEVTLMETHANVRMLLQKSPRGKLSEIVVGFQMLRFNILHLNVSTVGQWVFYSISAKVEDGSQLVSVDDIAGAIHQMLKIIEEEGTYASDTKQASMPLNCSESRQCQTSFVA